MEEIILKGKNNKNNIAVLVSLTKDVRPTVQRLMEIESYGYKSCIQLTSNPIASCSIVNTTHTDLFISASVQYAAYLGYYLNACASFEFWQYNILEDIHKPAIGLSALYDHDS